MCLKSLSGRDAMRRNWKICSRCFAKTARAVRDVFRGFRQNSLATCTLVIYFFANVGSPFQLPMVVEADEAQTPQSCCAKSTILPIARACCCSAKSRSAGTCCCRAAARGAIRTCCSSKSKAAEERSGKPKRSDEKNVLVVNCPCGSDANTASVQAQAPRTTSQAVGLVGSVNCERFAPVQRVRILNMSLEPQTPPPRCFAC